MLPPIRNRYVPLAFLLALGLGVGSASAGDKAAELRQRIAELKKVHEQQRQMPPEEQFALQEEQIAKYADSLDQGNKASGMYLQMARERLGSLRRQHFAKKWGDAVLDLEVATEELRRHGKRVAELKRVHHLARSRKMPNLIGQVEELLVAEKTRHEAHMQKLKAEFGPSARGASK